MSSPPDLGAPRGLWPTWILERHAPEATSLNLALLRLIRKEVEAAGGRGTPVFVSSDDLLPRLGDQSGALRRLFAFLSDAVFEAASAANRDVWPELGAASLRIAMVGSWCQVANDGGSHGVHSHGNCSWSGVYYVDLDDEAARSAHPRFGPANGSTRFHGPHLARLGGAHMDLGSAYLQHSFHDVPPVPGKAVIFPSWLLHEALPYEGERDRAIISFNAQLLPREGTAGLPYGT